MKLLLRKYFSVFTLVFFGTIGFGQTLDNPELKTFFASPTNSSVELNWVISAGFTCNGIQIFWSDDGTNFSQVGEIEGVCGSLSTALSYSFSHQTPSSNKTNYYKLELGFGSETQTISTFYVDLSSESYLILPNPAKENATIHFRNQSNRSIDFYLYDSNGRQVEKFNTVFDSKVELDVRLLPSGVYYFIISTEEGTTLKGKLLVEH